jgi:hypothetical protein
MSQNLQKIAKYATKEQLWHHLLQSTLNTNAKNGLSFGLLLLLKYIIPIR